MTPGFSIDVHAGQKAGAKLHAELGARLAAFLRADCERQAALVDELVSRGELDCVGGVWAMDYGDLETSHEVDYDAECEWTDPDEPPSAEGPEAYATPDEDTQEGVPSMRRAYVLRMLRHADRLECVPPENPFGGLRSRSKNSGAGQILLALRRQFEAYAAIAHWLQEETTGCPPDAAEFLCRHKGMTMKRFAKDRGLDYETLAYAVRNGCLAFEDTAIALSAVFTSA